MLLTNSFQNQEADQETTFQYILPACARISKALGAYFEPYLAVVMTPLLQGATQTVNFSMVDAGEDDPAGEVRILFYFDIYRSSLQFDYDNSF